MTQETLSAAAGIVISLLFFYLPGLKSWYGGLGGDYKRLVMLGALLLTTLGVGGLACSGYGVSFGSPMSCDSAGWVVLVRSFILAAIANQTTYLIAPAKRV